MLTKGGFDNKWNIVFDTMIIMIVIDIDLILIGIRSMVIDHL